MSDIELVISEAMGFLRIANDPTLKKMTSEDQSVYDDTVLSLNSLAYAAGGETKTHIGQEGSENERFI